MFQIILEKFQIFSGAVLDNFWISSRYFLENWKNECPEIFLGLPKIDSIRPILICTLFTWLACGLLELITFQKSCFFYRFNVPRWFAMLITALQLTQMVVGCLVNIWTYQIKEDGLECHVSDNNIKLSLLMYCSYFVLFARFFYNAYLKPKNLEKSKKRD